MTRALGTEVKYWVTINEANVLVHKGYIEGGWPPGKCSIYSALKAIQNMAKAHVRVYQMIHQTYASLGWTRPSVGIAHHFMFIEPSRKKSVLDRVAASMRRFINNDFFLRLIYHGTGDGLALVLGLGGQKKALDFVGINYYMREIIQKSSQAKGLLSLVGDVDHDDPRYVNSEHNDLTWEVYPPGIGHVIRSIQKKYRLPVMITENGICTHDEEQRRRFLCNHLKEILECIKDGAGVLGYMHWSLLDNFEWSIGYSPKFGLVHVDFDTQKRTLKKAASTYAQICRENALPAD